MFWLDSNEYETKGIAPSPREGHSVLKSFQTPDVFIIGGCDYSNSICHNDIFQLNIEVDISGKKILTWKKHETINSSESMSPREKHLSLATPYGGIILGGHGISPETRAEFPILLLLNTKCEISCNQSHGSVVNGQCICEAGYTGDMCDIKIKCKDNCNGNGQCIDSLCKCDKFHYGEACETEYCENLCNQNGECDITTGNCICYPGFTGFSCADTKLPENSLILLNKPKLLKERLDKTTLKIDENLAFIQDNIPLHGNCPFNCRSRGVCESDKCICLPEYFGPTCEFHHCKSTCGSESERGTCNHKNGNCDCFENFGGENCEFQCPYGCPDGFKCIGDYKCNCENCELPEYSFNCNEQGTLVGKECQCLPGNCGKFCEEKCPDCSAHGVYKGNCCQCDDGYFGENCELSCLNRCSDHGKCEEGSCRCESGWEGDDCSLDMRCPDDCNNRGSCNHGQCSCYLGFAGDGCEHTICPMNCTIMSSRYEIYTDSGYHSYKSREDIPLDMQGIPILEIINSAGYCNTQTQRCDCYPGYTGVMCDVPVYCPKNCTGHGNCEESGLCSCKFG